MMHGFGMGMLGWAWILVPLVLIGGGILVARSLGRRRADRLERRERAGGDSFARTVFRLAEENDGVVTVSDMVVETGLEPREAEGRLNDLVDGAHVTMEISDEGRVRYEFPELKRG